MTWSTITDGEIDAYSPIAARLMAKYRNNDRAVRVFPIMGMVQGVSAAIELSGDTADAWTSAGVTAKIYIYVPDYMIGDSGCRLSLKPDIEVVQAGTGSTTAQARIGNGADKSNTSDTVTIASAGSNRAEKDAMVLDFTPTANAIATIDVDFIISTTATIDGKGVLYLPKDRASNYMSEVP